jgi:hypothetical protein
MPREPWSDAERAVAVLAVLICEIRDSDDDERDLVLADFLHAAWPTRRAQRQ